jgi:hypothetical protein
MHKFGEAWTTSCGVLQHADITDFWAGCCILILREIDLGLFR